MADELLSDYLSMTQLAAELGKSPRTLERWRAHGELPPHTLIGHTRVFRRSSVVAWLESREKREVTQ